MENKLTAKELCKKIGFEFLDMLTAAAFPFMLMIILGATVIGFIIYGGNEDVALKAVILAVGEIMLIAATVIFGKQNGATAYKKTLSNDDKRAVGSSELKVKLRTGEYAPYKAAIIGFIACVPFIIVNLIYCFVPADGCKFMLSYIFGWAYYPFALASLSPWFNFICIIPYLAVHVVAYILGGKAEEKKQEIIASQNEAASKRRKK